MDTDTRPHRSNSTTATTSNSTTSTTSELFICFTSHLSSSSSMKISSKSILSPGRTRDSSHISLSSSLSRRLRSNGSLKGGRASPMFPATNGKKKGCAFENPEPSSPKVTCIGQVRVKSKKQGRKNRAARSKSRREVSFRKLDNQQTSTNTTTANSNLEIPSYQFQQEEDLPHRNQRWVHLPVTICEALRAFGAEFNCFLPCKSSCMASEREKEEKVNGSDSGGSSCGAVFARWLVAVQDVEGKAEREIELVVGGGEEEDKIEENVRSSQRRHVFEGLDIENFCKDGKFTEETGNDNVEEEEARVSICIPPKNALLLMRCRSDPVKMAALANKSWECPAPQDEDEEDEEEQGGENVESREGKKRDFDGGSNLAEEDEQRKVEIFTSHEEVMEEEENEVVGEKWDSRENSIEEQETVHVEAEAEDGQDCAAIKEADICHEVKESVVLEEAEEQEEDEETHGLVNKNQVATLVEEEIIVSQDEDTSHGDVALDLEESGNQEIELETELSKLMLLQENECSRQEEEQQPKPVLRQQEELRVIDDDELACDLRSSSFVSMAAEQESEVLLEEQKPEHEQVLEETEVEAVADESIEETHETAEEWHETSEEEAESGKTLERSEPGFDRGQDPGPDSRSEQREESSKQNVERETSKGLPDCLLLMMCEPKLSMEVSKETWVCSTDFIRWLPERPPPQKSQNVNKMDSTRGHDHQRGHKHDQESKKRPSIDSKPNNFQLQPPRSSCSFPAAPPLAAAANGGSVSMASMIEQKLVGSRAYEPFVLTRCKSEPMRSAAKLAPEACFWKNRKLEPHRPATLGVGAAGLGF